MEKYIKTTISRQKLYKRNYNSDTREIIKYNEKIDRVDKYKALVGILAQKYEDNKKRWVLWLKQPFMGDFPATIKGRNL